MSDTQPLAAALADRYRIERELGRGGMATVYLARDLKHERLVALKVLDPELGAVLGAERFLAEIRVTANLQHPNLLPLFDSGEADGLLWYAMPFVEGESLRARLAREQQLPIDEAVRIASGVANALAYAHSHGVIHRDLKPENILLQHGQPVVADFGIALAVSNAGGQRVTQTGLSLGTPQYMSPEQATGDRVIDGRTDIYSLGAVCYEMLAGEPPHVGATAQAVIAKLMTTEPQPVTVLRRNVPPHVEAAVHRALEKLPADRWPTAEKFAEALQDGRPGESRDLGSYRNLLGPGLRRGDDGAAGHPAPQSNRRLSLAFGAALVVASGLAAWGWMRAPAERAVTVTRVALALPAGEELRPDSWGFSFDLSADGRRIAYVGPGPTPGTSQVWIRPLDALRARALPGTVGTLGVRWSSDGRAVLAMMSQMRTLVVALDGSQSVTLTPVIDATCGADGRIYAAAPKSVIVRLVAGGARDTVVRGDTAFFLDHPMPFPHGDGVLYVRVPRNDDRADRSEIVAMSFATRRTSRVGLGVYARILGSGSLLYVSADGNAFVAPFDQSALRLTGPPVAIARVAMGGNVGRSFPQIAVSDEGTMVYAAGVLHRQRLVMLDAGGRLVRRLGIEGDLWGIDLSPDGSRLAFAVRTDTRDPSATARRAGDVWVADLATGARTRLTNEWFNLAPSWSPDGRSVLYARIGGAADVSLMERRADASEPERVLVPRSAFAQASPAGIGEGRWLPDHRTLLLRSYGKIDIFTMPASGGAAVPFVATKAVELAPIPSPDGSLVAYLSDESGTSELYVQRFPAGGERLAVSHGGASPARWSRDGRSLYYWNGRGELVVVSLASRPALAVTGTRTIGTDIAGSVFDGRSRHLFDVAPDGRIIAAESLPGPFDLVLVRNWPAGLARAAAP